MRHSTHGVMLAITMISVLTVATAVISESQEGDDTCASLGVALVMGTENQVSQVMAYLTEDGERGAVAREAAAVFLGNAEGSLQRQRALTTVLDDCL